MPGPLPSTTSPLDLPARDLDEVLAAVGPAWQQLRGQRLLLTGGTGFIGKWLLGSLLHADRALDLGVQVSVLSRRPQALLDAHPDLRGESRLQWLCGDVRHFTLPPRSRFDLAIHAATDVVANQTPAEVLDVCSQGTAQVLHQARAAGVQRLLLLSSGAVYGRQPTGLARLPEDHAGAPDPLQPASAYGEGKRMAELLAVLAAQAAQAASADGTPSLQVPVARCFAFAGPHLPLDAQFAIGNFIGAALRGEALVIQGDGTPLRSYLYASDMAAWLWVLLLRGQSGRAYNVGGDEAVSIQALAERVIHVLGVGGRPRVLRTPPPGQAPQAYLPDLGRAQLELGLRAQVGLDEAIARSADWHRSRHATRETACTP